MGIGLIGIGIYLTTILKSAGDREPN